MKIRIIQHAETEGEGIIRNWAEERGHAVAKTFLYRGKQLPRGNDFDCLFIMGGPMSVHDEEEYPFLEPEKRFIAGAVSAGKKIIGICLGAQLLAEVLGAEVKKSREREIGWFDVTLEEGSGNVSLLDGFPPSFTAFHWHGDTFDIPRGAVRLAASHACDNQAFVLGGNALGMQFHLEVTPEVIESWFKAPEDRFDGPFIQDPGVIRKGYSNCPEMHRLLFSLLDRFCPGGGVG
jgi:GMP synthase-like glutamine amidotransferase